MRRDFGKLEVLDQPVELPELGIGSITALNSLAPSILGGSARLAHHLHTWTRQPHG